MASFACRNCYFLSWTFQCYYMCLCILCLNDDDYNHINNKAITNSIKVKMDYYPGAKEKKIKFTSFSLTKNHDNYSNYRVKLVILLFRFTSLKILSCKLRIDWLTERELVSWITSQGPFIHTILNRCPVDTND